MQDKNFINLQYLEKYRVKVAQFRKVNTFMRFGIEKLGCVAYGKKHKHKISRTKSRK